MASGQNIFHKIRHFAAYLAKPDILFYALPWLMILIVIGTVTQKELGLYVATEKYIHSIIFWLGPIPLPGGLTTIGVIFLALSIKFIFFSAWQWKQVGTILTHLGVLLLLLGGIVTASVSREGFMIIPEGQSNNSISDYKKKVLVFSKDGRQLKTINFEEISVNNTYEIGQIKIKISDVCKNCSAQAPSGKYKNLQGLAVNMALVTVPDQKNIEENFSGLTFELLEAQNQDILGNYIVMEDIPKNPIIDDIKITLERQKTNLPFSIFLKDFKKIDYPGTRKAREYESDLIIQDNDISWPVTIKMNEPLRYKGYSFYQSSFEQLPDTELTVLNVVKNSGWLFPYISTLIIFAGLLLHLIIRLQTKRGVAE